MYSAAHGLAYNLSKDGKIKVGDRVLLVFFPGLHFMVSLLACFLAGYVAVPVFPPDPRKLKKDLHHFVSIQTNSNAEVVLTHSLYNFAKKVTAITNIFSSSGDTKWPNLEWISVDDVINKAKTAALAPSDWVPPLVGADRNSVAFLQYTSGSTSEPKGVMITHNNLAHNCTLVQREIKSNQDTVNISWLPQYHDMGLIGSYLGLVYCGGSGFYTSPVSFLKDPLLWLRMISVHKGTHTQAPNFAFALATRKFRELRPNSIPIVMGKSFDLSSVQHMINAAEPIDNATIAGFYGCFKVYGLTKPEVIVPTYGLAEHTVFVCSGGTQSLMVDKHALERGTVVVLDVSKSLAAAPPPQTDGVCIVGCGYPGKGEGVKLLIVDVDSCIPCEPSRVGEIWVTSPSKAVGYWGNPTLSKKDFHAYVNEVNGKSCSSSSDVTLDFSSDGYLRTGDLGFMYHGELFICGREKDLIIVRGTNHYPQDIERCAEDAIKNIARPGCSAAFSLKTKENPETEAVVYIVEARDINISKENCVLAANTVRDVVANTHGISLSSICILKPRTIPKTTSGKVARTWCRKGFTENTLEVYYRQDAKVADNMPVGLNVQSVSVDSTISPRVAGSGNEADMGSHATDFGVLSPEISVVGALPNDHIGMSLTTDAKVIPLPQLLNQLTELLIKTAASSGHELERTRGTVTAPLTSLGLDSMTLVQFKGILDKRYVLCACCKICLT